MKSKPTVKSTVSPPSSLRHLLRHLLRQGYEGQEGYDRQAGPVTGSFNNLHPKSVPLAKGEDMGKAIGCKQMVMVFAAWLLIGGACLHAQGKQVGIAYTTWFPTHWGNNGSMVWGEPELGYYSASDHAIIDQHTEWLTDAGVDFLLMDWSNNIDYAPGNTGRFDLENIENSTMVLADRMAWRKNNGLPYLKVAIMMGAPWDCNAYHDGRATQKAYQIKSQFLDHPQRRSVYFEHRGKPLLVDYCNGCTTINADWANNGNPWNRDNGNLNNHFTIRHIAAYLNWLGLWNPNTGISRHGYWTWDDSWAPVPSYSHDGRPEVQTVWPAVRGNGWHGGDTIGRNNGATFRASWQFARDRDVDIALVNSWNEWVGNANWSGEQLDQERSREVEPMKGGHGDLYLRIMKEEIALFKGIEEGDATYDFDDGTLQGWTDRTPSNNNSGPRNWALSPPAFPGVAHSGSGAIGQQIEGGNQDSSHPTLWLRSPEFRLDGSGDLRVWLRGGAGSGSLTGVPVSNVPVNSSNPGFQGVALRNVNTETFVLSASKNSSGDSWEQIAFTASQLAALDQNATYTLDLIDAGHGGWGWVAMDSVTIPGATVVFNFDNGTMQGWSLTSTDGQGRQYFAVVPPDEESPNVIPHFGSHFIGLHVPSFTLDEPIYTQDNGHGTLVLRSPEFTLNGGGGLNAWLSGGGAGSPSLAGTSVSALPAQSSDGGFRGIALRNVNTGNYVLSGTKTSGGNEWEQVGFSEAQLAALDQNATYTLDLIDAGHGGWGWVNMDSVSIPGMIGVPNTAPTISNVANRTINEDSNTGAIAFTIGDIETAAASLTLTGSSSNTTLVPNANIVFGGSGANRTVTVTPATNQSGTATITLTVSDGELSTGESFLLTVLSSATPLTYNFDDGTPQGWTTSGGTGDWAFGAVDNPGGWVHKPNAHSGNYQLTMIVDGLDDAHNTAWARSPEFRISVGTAITLQVWGHATFWDGNPNWNTTANPMGNASDVPATTAGDGFVGLALRRVSDGAFVRLGGRQGGGGLDHGNSWQSASMGDLSAFVSETESYTLDVIDQRDGGWGGMGVDSVTIPGTLVEPPPPADPYLDWAATMGLNGPAAAFDADPDGDGIANGLEFVLGGQPNPANPGWNSLALLPTATLDGAHYVFTYRRSHAAAYLGPVVEFTGDPAGQWTAADDGVNAAIAVVPVPGAAADMVSVAIPAAGLPRLFVRLKVTTAAGP